jgi:hypothetical protein
MDEPIVPDAAAAVNMPSPIEAALTAYRASAADQRPLTVVYAPTSVTHHHAAPATTTAVQDAPVRMLPGPATPVAAPTPTRRRFTRAELCFHVGMAVTGTGAVAVALSIAAGDPSWLLAVPPVVGCTTILGSAMAINREESHRSAP